MKNPLKTGIALAALTLLAMGVAPARADDVHNRYNGNRGRGRNDVDVHLDFGRRDNYRSRRYDDYQYRDYRGRNDHRGGDYRYEQPRYRDRRYDDCRDSHRW